MEDAIFILAFFLYGLIGILDEKIEAELLKIDNRLNWYVFFDKIFAYAMEEEK